MMSPTDCTRSTPAGAWSLSTGLSTCFSLTSVRGTHTLSVKDGHPPNCASEVRPRHLELPHAGKIESVLATWSILTACALERRLDVCIAALVVPGPACVHADLPVAPPGSRAVWVEAAIGQPRLLSGNAAKLPLTGLLA